MQPLEVASPHEKCRAWTGLQSQKSRHGGYDGRKEKKMLYRITYKRRSDRDKNKWTEFRVVLQLKELIDRMKWLEKNSDSHKLIKVEPF